MKKTMMLFAFLFSGMLFTANAQKDVEVKNGPALTNDEDCKMNRMLGGDENSFYCYRVRSRGKGTSFFVEKYDKATLKPLFSKEISVGEEDDPKIEDVEYTKDNVYVFRRKYDKDKDKMTLSYQTVSNAGVVSKVIKPMMDIKSDHFEFVDFDVYPNPSSTKFLVKVSHKPSKDAKYVTDFVLYEVGADGTLKQGWTKSVDLRLFSSYTSITILGFTVKIGDVEYNGLHFDDKDNFYFCYSNETKSSTDKEKHWRLNLTSFYASSTTPVNTELLFDDDYYVGDIEFSRNKTGDLVVGGFLKDVIERKGRDLVKVGIFSFIVNSSTGAVLASKTKTFDDKILYNLESNPRRSRYFKYKMDYILSVGEDTYFIGEQYNEYLVQNRSSYGLTTNEWHYEYMDVIIAKQNSKGEFEWISNAPLRQAMILQYRHVFKQYIALATDKSIYILNNDHEKNLDRYKAPTFEPADLKTMSSIHGSNFVFSKVNLSDGKVRHELIFENETYCFAPIQERNPQFMPPSDTEIFVPGKKDEIYIYTEDRGKDKFARITFKP